MCVSIYLPIYPSVVCVCVISLTRCSSLGPGQQCRLQVIAPSSVWVEWGHVSAVLCVGWGGEISEVLWVGYVGHVCWVMIEV
jgi:hypothetical protein